jgi:hypothetical protein
MRGLKGGNVSVVIKIVPGGGWQGRGETMRTTFAARTFSLWEKVVGEADRMRGYNRIQIATS